MTFRDVAKQIANKLDESDARMAALRGDPDGPDAWYRKALSRLTLLVGGETPVYVSGVVDELAIKGEPFARIVVLTETRLLHSYVALHGGDPREYEPEVTAIARGSLVGIQAHGVHSLFDNRVDAPDWPGSFQLQLTYPGDNTIVLPVGRATVTNGKVLYPIVPSLLEDLSK